ncbi:MAG TPA: FAD-dependent oxidoreductase [Candidatus Udaeobacter sp.]|nr:FAD-dependent oxidoreductase [Candidatus Udaeobacter sp.]
MKKNKVSPNGQTEKSAVEDYDLVILGGGTGATIAAWTFAGEGRSVAVIERKYVGGSCPNIACLPSKNVIHSAKVASYFRRSEEFGIARKSYTVDMTAVRDRKRRMVSFWNDAYMGNYKKTGAEFILGSGHFVGPKTLEVTLPDGKTRQLCGANVIINIGTRAAMEVVPGLVEAKPLTHIEALELGEVPKHLVVLGGGYIGLEFAQAMRRFGSKVTVIDRNARVMHREDDDVTEELQRILEEEGVKFELNARVRSVSGKSGQSVKVAIEEGGKEKTIGGSHLQIAAGRVPNTEGIGLELAGVHLTAKGYIQVNEHLATTAPGVWAIGEVAGSPQFTHVSVDDFRVVHDSITGGKRVTTGRLVPFCVFTDPEFARVGLSEKEAKEKGVAYRLFKVPMEAVMRATTMAETRGFMKALIAADGDRILGFTAVGVGAGEVLGTVQVAMMAGLPYTALRDTMLTHPTLVEGLIPLFSGQAESIPSAEGPDDSRDRRSAVGA